MSTNGIIAIARAFLLSSTKKCVETCGDTPGSVSFTYPSEYVEGMEFSCSITVCPDSGTEVVLYNLDKLVGEFKLDNGRNRAEKIANLMLSLEEFQKFCSKCDDDLLFVKVLMARERPMKPKNKPFRFENIC